MKKTKQSIYFFLTSEKNVNGATLVKKLLEDVPDFLAIDSKALSEKALESSIAVMRLDNDSTSEDRLAQLNAIKDLNLFGENDDIEKAPFIQAISSTQCLLGDMYFSKDKKGNLKIRLKNFSIIDK